MGDGTDSFTKGEMNIHMGRFQTQINPGRGGLGRPGPKSGTTKTGLPPPSLVGGTQQVSNKKQQRPTSTTTAPTHHTTPKKKSKYSSAVFEREAREFLFIE